jgi:hypothetical protein
MRFRILSALLLVALVVPNLHAQSNQLEKSQMAVVSFDFDMDKIRNSAMSKTLDLESKIKDAAKRSSDKLDPAKVKRIYGASSAPESMEEAQGYKGEGPLPVEFFARVELVDAAAAEEAIKQIQEKGEAVEIGGKTFYKSTDDGAPKGLLAHRVDDSTIEMGTEAYLLRADRKVFTDGLTAAFKKAPDEAVKIAMDLEGASDLVAELQEMAAENGPPNFAAYYELIGAVSDMHITIDMDGDNLLTIGMTGKSESQAEDVEGGLGSLIGMGQMFGMSQVGTLKQINPDLGGMAEKMLEALNASREGKDVSVKLIHPEGLADAIKAMIGG